MRIDSHKRITAFMTILFKHLICKRHMKKKMHYHHNQVRLYFSFFLLSQDEANKAQRKLS